MTMSGREKIPSRNCAHNAAFGAKSDDQEKAQYE
jgi:hypothetical protein